MIPEMLCGGLRAEQFQQHVGNPEGRTYMLQATCAPEAGENDGAMPHGDSRGRALDQLSPGRAGWP
jgi:hypothetical protein